MKKYINTQQAILPYKNIPNVFDSAAYILKIVQLINMEELKANSKSPIDKKHRNNCYRQNSVMNDKISRRKFEEKRDICIVLTYPPIIFIDCKVSNSSFTERKPNRHHLTK